jgi:exonuclease III
LVRVCSKDTLPIIIGGDFNIIRSPVEKNNENYSDRWPFLFNAVIDTLNLRELELTGRKFTWANRLQNQTFEKLDRILVCTDFESKYPLSTVVALNREISDHTPLFLAQIVHLWLTNPNLSLNWDGCLGMVFVRWCEMFGLVLL